MRIGLVLFLTYSLTATFPVVAQLGVSVASALAEPVRDPVAFALAIERGDLKGMDEHVSKLVFDNGEPVAEDRSTPPSPTWNYRVGAMAEVLRQQRGLRMVTSGYTRWGNAVLIVSFQTANGPVDRSYSLGTKGKPPKQPKDPARPMPRPGRLEVISVLEGRVELARTE
jgi:hypothetical protein